MKIFIVGAVCFVIGWLAVEAGLIPPELVRIAGFVLAIPARYMVGSQLSKILNDAQGFLFVIFMILFLVFIPVIFGVKTITELTPVLEFVLKYKWPIIGFTIVAFVVFLSADKAKV